MNIDATILAQAPKLAPYRARMRRNIAGALGIDTEQVGVKATTEEGLGFTGDGSGMAAHAVVFAWKHNIFPILRTNPNGRLFTWNRARLIPVIVSINFL